VFLEDILDAGVEQMSVAIEQAEHSQIEGHEFERAAHVAGLSAIVIQDLHAKRGKDYSFDLSRMTAFKGDTGPYLQYTHARLSR